MRDKIFLDTNILIYLYSNTDEDKKQKAIDILKNYDCVISTQVINELCNVCTWKLKKPVEEVRQAVDHLKRLCLCETVTTRTALYALDLHEKYRFSFFDSLMLSAANLNGCKFILSEDMHDGQKIDGLEIVNIFKREI